MEYERLAFDAALRALDKQEALLDELRGRTGALMAASALAASFLGAEALEDPAPGLAAVALLAFVASVGASVFILVPRRDRFTFSISGPGLYEGLYEIRDDLSEVYRHLAYDLLGFWEANDGRLKPLFRAYRVGAGALVVEILALIASRQRYDLLSGMRLHADSAKASATSSADARSRPARNPRWQRRSAHLVAAQSTEITLRRSSRTRG